MANFGHWPLDIGHWTLDIGHWTLDSGNWKLEIGHWTLDIGHWTLDIGHWTLDFGHWTSAPLLPLPAGLVCRHSNGNKRAENHTKPSHHFSSNSDKDFPKNEAFCGRKKAMENERKRKSPDQTVFDGALFASS
ncbi:conserved hypothetical protein [Culex quinquefasciatus]|uniref:Uncharacterized protein n=1 Tax=Culex quinquefasciatus TaxID=7176 RepID=B0X245_CULQU|nr:conserved hypothetical protein [Culex quinquefasciatus]|eukprot:XP_001863717.1 conserved hypothetical protein [Culex quinquefasciatus]